jgi:hypothetical protein
MTPDLSTGLNTEITSRLYKYKPELTDSSYEFREMLRSFVDQFILGQLYVILY